MRYFSKNLSDRIVYKQKLLLAACMAPLLLTLSACAGGKTGKISAFSQQPPDEFAVIINPPLVVPPGDALLPAPSSLDKKPVKKSASDFAEQRGLQTIFGENSNAVEDQQRQELEKIGLTAGDIALLVQAGATSGNLQVSSTANQQVSQLESTPTEIAGKKSGFFSGFTRFIGGLFGRTATADGDKSSGNNVVEKKYPEEINVSRPNTRIMQ